MKLSPVSMALVVIVRKAYGEGCGVDYPNLAGKAKYASLGLNAYRICARPSERVQFPEALSLTFEDESNEE